MRSTSFAFSVALLPKYEAVLVQNITAMYLEVQKWRRGAAHIDNIIM